MKRLLGYGIILMIFLFSCGKKDSSPDVDGSRLNGKWHLVSDSSFAGVGLGNHAVNYTGRAGDYFDFRPGGHLLNERERHICCSKLYCYVRHYGDYRFLSRTGRVA